MCTPQKCILNCYNLSFQTATVINELCKKYSKMYEMAIVCSFDPRVVYAVSLFLLVSWPTKYQLSLLLMW